MTPEPLVWRVPMFGRKDREEQQESLIEARMAQARALNVIAHVEAQDPEVLEKVRYLELHRTLGDDFGFGLLQAMGRKDQ